MKLSTYLETVAQLTLAAAFLGCLPTDLNRTVVDPCDDNATTAEAACADIGLRAVSECPATDFGTCREVAFFNGCDQLEVALCAGNEDCAEPAVAIGYRVEDICAEHGLVPAYQDECDWIESVEFGSTDDSDDAIEPVIVDAVDTATESQDNEGDAESESGFATKCAEMPEAQPQRIAPERLCFEVELPSVCGWSDFVLCKEPDVWDCPEVYDPVCGVDGVTYGNACEARGVNIAHDGECEASCSFLYEPVCGIDGITYVNSCTAEERGTPIAYEGECIPVDRGTCINDYLLSPNSTVRLSIEHTSDAIDVPRDNPEAEEDDEAPIGLTIAPGEFTNIGVRLDARQHGVEHRDSNSRFREMDIQVRSFKLYTGARFEDFQEVLVEEGPSEVVSPIQLIEDRSHTFDQYLEGRFVAEFTLRVGVTSCTFRGEVDTELQAAIEAWRHERANRD